MLVELSCDKFKDEGAIRGPLRFHRGLNVVLGTKDAKNSIGKSTSLLAIDFAFGGNSYANAQNEIVEHIGHHKIGFVFEFDGKRFLFERGTDELELVYPCDETGTAREPWGIEAYRKWLLEKYHMEELGGTFRDLASGFFRVYGKDNHDERRPLKAFGQDGAGNGVKRLTKLFGHYAEIKRLQDESNDAAERAGVFGKVLSYGLLEAPTNKSEVKKNVDAISELKDRCDELVSERRANALLEIDAVTAERAAAIRHELSKLKRVRSRLRAKLRSLKDDDLSVSAATAREFRQLSEFFPSVDLRHIEEIEGFHKSLSRVLEKERKAVQQETNKSLEEIDEQISALTKEVESMGSLPDVPTATLDEYAHLRSDIERLERANRLFERRADLKEKKSETANSLKERSASILRGIERAVNERLEELNAEVYGAGKTAPTLRVPNTSRYELSVPHDAGTGAQTRAMFLLDYTLLLLTPLPAIAHDTVNIKQVEDDVIVRLLELYESSEKQVFVAVDKAETLAGSGLPPVVRRNTVLELSSGHELFGWSWNNRTEG